MSLNIDFGKFINPLCPCNNLPMLVLASASPRRREHLAQAGYSFEVHPAHIPENPNPNEDPTAYVTRLAREKAAFREITIVSVSDQRASAALQVLAVDATVTLDNQIFGKPSSPDSARMLRLLSGRTHQVITGIALVTASSTQVVRRPARFPRAKWYYSHDLPKL
jgi:septum formation protein